MKKFLKKSIKDSNGITLIALVITIIVLLILAGISITMLSGDNSILQKAGEANDTTRIAQIRERIQLAELAANTDGLGNLEYENLIKELNQEFGENKYTISAKSSNPWVVTVDGVSEDINHEEKTILAATVANNANTFFGASVQSYECDNSAGVTGWKIFYADEKNIYLIADDYVSYQYVPNGKSGSVIYKNSTDYDLSFNNIVNDYNGFSDITSDTIKQLNSDFFEKGYSSATGDYTKAVSYMLDTEAWKGFCGEKGIYAIGGPSIELFLKSYNKKYNKDYTVLAYDHGYLVDAGYKLDSSVWSGLYNQGSFKLEQHDELYSIASEDRAKGMWFASPAIGAGYTSDYNGLLSVSGNDRIGTARVNGATANYDVVAGTGFRPVVCLKDTVKLIDNGDGTYLLK